MLREWRKLKASLLLLVVSMVAAGAIGRYRMSSYVERTAGPLHEKLSSLGVDAALFPKTVANQTALELRELALELGIDLAVRKPGLDESTAQLPEEPVLTQVNERSREMAAWVDDVEGRASATTSLESPESLDSLARQIAPTVDRVVDVVLSRPPVVWESDISAGFEAPLPNLLGQLQLQRALCVAAELALREGRRELGERRLEASWKLNEALLSRPELIAQLVAQAVVKVQQPVIRRLPASSGVLWLGRLEGLSQANAAATALRFEALSLLQLSENPGEMRELLTEDLPWLGGLGDLYANWGLVTAAARIDQGVEQMLEQNPAIWDGRLFFQELIDSVPLYNLYAKLLLPDLWDSWTKAKRRELEVEHTVRLLELRSGAEEKPRSEHPESEVAGLRWIYQQDGPTRRVFLDGDLAHLPARDRALPLDYTIHLDREMDRRNTP